MIDTQGLIYQWRRTNDLLERLVRVLEGATARGPVTRQGAGTDPNRPQPT